MSNLDVKWAAQLENVHDVSLRGFADLEFWAAYVEPYGVTPAVCNGKAEIIIIGGDARFRGVPFRELSFALMLAAEHAAAFKDAAFLLHSFNSCRFFAFCERVFFSTPYTHANVSLSPSLPASIKVEVAREEVFQIAMGDTEVGVRLPTFCGREDWDGAVYLPYDLSKNTKTGKVFFSRVQGEARKFSYDILVDKISIKPEGGPEVLTSLIESEFIPYEWIMRKSSTHAKSKTYLASTDLFH